MLFRLAVWRHGGKTLKSFDQANMTDRFEREDLKKGVCAALSHLWVAKNANGDDFYDYLETVAAYGEISQLQGREKAASAIKEKGKLPLANAVVQSTNRERQRDMADSVEQRTNLTATCYSDVKPDVGLKMATSGREGYRCYSMHGQKSGHEVAMHVSQQGVRFFDPNMGEAFFPTVREFNAFFAELQKDYASELTGLGALRGVDITSFPAPMPARRPEDTKKPNGERGDLTDSTTEVAAAQEEGASSPVADFVSSVFKSAKEAIMGPDYFSKSSSSSSTSSTSSTASDE